MLEYYIVGNGMSFCMGVVTKMVMLAPASTVTGETRFKSLWVQVATLVVALKSTVEVQ